MVPESYFATPREHSASHYFATDWGGTPAAGVTATGTVTMTAGELTTINYIWERNNMAVTTQCQKQFMNRHDRRKARALGRDCLCCPPRRH